MIKNNRKRIRQHLLKDRHYQRKLEISPDVKLDFTNLPFANDSFAVVVFDPPHLVRAGSKSWLAKKYGVLGNDWKSDLEKGFAECFRVLKPDGLLVFKWNENQIMVKEILTLTDQKPLFGHVSMKHKKNQTKTHWIVFLKENHIGDSRMEAEELQREKEHFEKWARSIGANDERLKWVDVWEGEGYYFHSEMDYAWQGWLAKAENDL